jgi:very-short-patch-repair endonuclease
MSGREKDEPRSDALPIRRQLRRRGTEAERLLWSVVRRNQLGGMKFYRQYSVDTYIVDFACPAGRLVVEIDGEYHDLQGQQDLQRQQAIENMGWRVVRFSNAEVLKELEDVRRGLTKALGVEG